MKLLIENWNKFLNEADEKIQAGKNLVILSDWAQGHITGGHTKSGQGSIFMKLDMSLIIKAIQSAQLPCENGVCTVDVSSYIGYDLVMPMDEALALPNAEKVSVQKEDRRGPIEVVGIKTSKPIEKFATNKLSVVIRPSTMEYVPDSLKQDPEVQAAAKQNRLYGVLSSWPGRGDVPGARDWEGKWAVIIPQG